MPPEVIALLQELAATPLGAAVRESAWLYPVLETVHVIGLGLVLGGVVVVDLRMLGLNADLPMRRLCVHVLPWVWLGFLLNLCSGLMLFLSDAVAFGENRAFQIKLLLLVLVGLNTIWYLARVNRSLDDWSHETGPGSEAKVVAVVSLVLWIGVITAGRMIAYWE